MKLIIEKSYGTVHAYFEDGKQFAVTQRSRAKEMIELSPAMLDLQCDLAAYADGTFFVMEVTRDG